MRVNNAFIETFATNLACHILKFYVELLTKIASLGLGAHDSLGLRFEVFLHTNIAHLHCIGEV